MKTNLTPNRILHSAFCLLHSPQAPARSHDPRRAPNPSIKSIVCVLSALGKEVKRALGVRVPNSAFCILNSAFRRVPLANDNPPTLKPLLIGVLQARGVAITNAAPDQTVAAEITKLIKAGASADAALANDQAALQNDLDTARQALAGEKSARAAERATLAEMAVDLAIQRGKLTLARREEKIAALANSADFKTAAADLLAGASVVKVPGDSVAGKQHAALANEQAEVQAQYDVAFQKELAATGQNPSAAHRNIMTKPEYANLAAKLMPKTI